MSLNNIVNNKDVVQAIVEKLTNGFTIESSKTLDNGVKTTLYCTIDLDPGIYELAEVSRQSLYEELEKIITDKLFECPAVYEKIKSFKEEIYRLKELIAMNESEISDLKKYKIYYELAKGIK